MEYQYDPNSNVILSTARDRFHDATGTGALGTPTTGVKARVSYAATYYDQADRLVTDINVGTYGNNPFTRPATPPARYDTILRNDYVYNSAGWLEDVIDPRGIINRTEYDDLGRTARTIQAYTDGVPSNNDDRTTEYEYDGNGNTLRVRAVLPGGAVQMTQYVYGASTATGSALNSNDIRTETRYPDKITGLPSSALNERETLTYNALGQVLTSTDRNGSIHAYSYDVLGRVIADIVTTLGAGVDGSIRRIDTSYDTAGRVFKLTSYADTMGTTIANQVQRDYNGYGQLIREYQAHGGAVVTATTPKVTYNYSTPSNSLNASRLTSMVYPNGRTLAFNYSGTLNGRISRLDNLTFAGTQVEKYSYLGLSTVVRREHNQSKIDLTYIKQGAEPIGEAGDQYSGLDRFSRIVDQRWRNSVSGTETDRNKYTYDRNSNRTAKTNELNHALDEFFSYDNLDQLLNFGRGSHTQAWDMDAQGNFETVTTDGIDQDRTHNAQNQLTGVSSAVNPTFDANGNMTRDETGRTLEWDAWNRLVRVKDSGGSTLISYTYDALSRKITENPGTVRDLYYSAAWQVLEERVANVAQVQYVWSPVYIDAMILRDRDMNGDGIFEERLYPTHDANFNITSLSDAAGTILERFATDPYGAFTTYDAAGNVIPASVYGWKHHFQTLMDEPLTGLAQARFRWYSFTLMRWVSVDPIGFAAGNLNLYIFASDNPIAFVDPTGLQAEPCLCGTEVGPQLTKGLKMLEEKFKAKSVEDKLAICNQMYSPTVRGWDINQFYNTGNSKEREFFTSGNCGTGNCKITVTVNGECHIAGEVNYVLWGRMNRLCNDLISNAIQRPAGKDRTEFKLDGNRTIVYPSRPYSLEGAIGLMKRYRYIMYGYRYLTGKDAGVEGREAWTNAGWHNDFSLASPVKQDARCGPCKVPYKGTLTFSVGAHITGFLHAHGVGEAEYLFEFSL